jgi:PAS domain S-box-containing protein
MGGNEDNQTGTDGEPANEKKVAVSDGGMKNHKVLAEKIDQYFKDEVNDKTVRDAYEYVTDGFLAVDEDWSLTYLNQKAADLLNANEDELLGKPLPQAFSGLKKSPLFRELEEAMEDRSSLSYEYYYEPLGKWFHINAYPSDGGMSIYFQDITDTKKREQNLKDVQKTYRKIAEETHDGIAIVQDEKIAYVNSSLTDILGETKGTMLDEPFYKWFVGEDIDLVRDRYAERIEGKKPPEQYDVRMETSEGEVRDLEVSVTRITYKQEPAVLATFRDITERKERERELERYKKFVEESSDAIILVDEDGTVLYNSPSFEDILGHGQDERVGENAFGYVHPDDKERVMNKFELLKQKPEGKVGDIEFRAEKDDGSYIWVEAVGSNHESGDIGAFVINIRDISDRKKREHELKRYKSIVENSTDIISHLDKTGIVLYHSPSIEEALGYGQEDWIGENVFEYVHPEDVERVRDEFMSLLGGSGKKVEVEYRIQHNDGSYVWIESKGHDKRDSELGGVIVNSRDITDRKKREQKIREIKEKLDLAVGAADIGIWDWDVKSDEVRIDPERYSMVEKIPDFSSNSKITIDDWRERIHPDDLSEAWDDISRHLDGEAENFDVEVRLRTAENDWMWIRSLGEVVERDDDGEPKRAVGVHINIDERRRRETVLERQNEYLRRIKQASQEMISAESRGEVAEILVKVSGDLFENAFFYSWENGVLRSQKEDITSGDDDPAWSAFIQGDTMLSEMNSGEWETYDGEGLEICIGNDVDVQGPVRLDTPIGERGVLSVRLPSICEPAESFIRSLATAADTSLERIEKENNLRRVAEEMQEKNEELGRLSEIHDVIRQVIKKVIESDSIESIQQTVCKQLLEIDDWDYTWFVERNEGQVSPTCCHGNEMFTERLMDSLEDSPVSETLEDGELRIVNDTATTDISQWRSTVLNEGYLSVATVPIQHGGRDFGVLEVYSTETESFRGGYADALEDVASVVGYSFTAAEQISSILSGGYNRITLRIDKSEVDCVFSKLVQRLNAEFRINTVVPESDGTIVYFKTDADEIWDAAEDMGIDISETINGYSVTVSDMSVVDRAMELGGRVSKYAPGETDLIVDVDLPQGTDARQLLDVVSEDFPSVELVAKKPGKSPDYSESPLDSLTERQKTALKLAYENGFFKTPREKTGEEISESMGITATTFHQHLRSAEEKIVDAIIDTG